MSTQIQLDFDICAKRHGNNPQSRAAHSRIVGTKAETYERILNYVEAVKGATSKEIAKALGKQLNCVSPRLSELKAQNRLRETGNRRLGSAELSLVNQ